MVCIRYLLFFAGIIVSFAASPACVVRDDAGHTLKLTQAAKRLVVLAPDLVENVFAIGAGTLVVGVVQGSDYPAAALQIPTVGSYAGIDLERIVALKPDVIIAWQYAFPRQLAALQRLGIPVYVAAPKQLEDIPRLQRHLGCLTNQTRTAEAAAKQFERELRQLQTIRRVAPPPKVFFQIDRYALITINKDSWINQVIALCGGKNLFADAKAVAPEINRESLLIANPDVIFNIGLNDDWQSAWQNWGEITAVKRHHLFTITPDLISRAGPRLVAGARQVCHNLAALQAI